MHSSHNSIFVLVDVQGRLAEKMHHKDSLFYNIKLLIQVMRLLEIPVNYTEQVPDKIDKTLDEFAILLDPKECITKDTFSCWGEENFQEILKERNPQSILIAGIEAHVCICQTVLDLIEQKYHVAVVADAVSARTEEQKMYAIERMRSHGADIVTTEMLVTELIKTGSHPKFKDILNLIK